MNIAVITAEINDFSKTLEKVCEVTYIKPDEIHDYDLNSFNTICILGGTEEEPFVLDIDSRNTIEKIRLKGKKVFAEYLMSVDNIYSADSVSTRFSRLVYEGEELNNLKAGDILDDQCNNFTSSYYKLDCSRPVLVYKRYINSHKHTTLSDNEKNDFTKWGLWYLDDKTLICSFRLCNFIKARFAPIDKWNSLVLFIIKWITGSDDINVEFEKEYIVGGYTEDNFRANTLKCIERGISWFKKSGILLNNGNMGLLEGFHHDIDANGNQKTAKTIRADCTGETSGAFYTHYLLTKNKESLSISDALDDFIFNKMQVKEGLYKGMIRWTSTAYGVCYQDDVARAIIPSMLKIIYSGTKRHLKEIEDALLFLVNTTGTDGLRKARTDILNLSEKKMKELRETKADFPCAHYNAYYHASLLLGYIVTGNEMFRDAAVKGLSSIMKVYPETIREQSETEELCRLIFPLSVLYKVTKDERHKEWIYTVCMDLQKCKHNGTYIEWDTDYKALRSRKKDSECSLLTENGDPVCDLLYSVNWLPLGFIYAYLATGDSMFYELWKEITVFFLNAQIKSDNPNINGAWARGFDIESTEVYGVPHDIGWGPWAIESGWTVGEILMGISLGLNADNLTDFYS